MIFSIQSVTHKCVFFDSIKDLCNFCFANFTKKQICNELDHFFFLKFLKQRHVLKSPRGV